MCSVPEGLKEEKDATALLARKQGSCLVTLGIEAEFVRVLEKFIAATETVSPDALKADEETALEQATKTKTQTEAAK